MELMRSSADEKDQQVANVEAFRASNADEGRDALERLQRAARQRANTFETLMETARYCSLGTMSSALYAVGGEYRRNM